VNSFFKQFLRFNRRERRGILILLGIISAQILVLSFSDIIFKPQSNTDFSNYLAQVEEYNKTSTQIEKLTEESDQVDEQKFVKHFQIKQFDPNTVTNEELKQFGFSDKLAGRIINYRNKGGKFKRKTDFSKMYGMSPELYNRVEAYINLPDTISAYKTYDVKIKKLYVENTVDLNSTDSLSLIKVKGIGPVFAHRIISYRDKLGGFISSEQLLEVYGFNAEKLEELKSKLIIEPVAITKLNINKLGFAELKIHPYINYNLAKAIVNYRLMHGNYKNIEAIKNIDLLNDDLYSKIAPYLTIE